MKKSIYIKFCRGPVAFILMNSIILSTFAQNAVPKNLSKTNKANDPALVTITLGSINEAKPINTLFSGISIETEAVRPSENGSYYFSVNNTRLTALFRQLGVRHLRIGGNTVDDLTKTPTLADIDQLFAFAKLAKVKVTYSVRLKNGDPKESAKIAKHIYSRYKDIITGITIGNETDQYYKNRESEYLADAKLHFKAMREAAPDVTINGPSIHLNAPWLLNYAEAFKTEAKIDYIGAHAYFGGNAYGNTTPPVDRDPAPLWKEMLSAEWQEKYDNFYNAFGPELHKLNIPFRIDETNTYYMGGAPGASNAMAASIWALDYLYWWADHGAQGINFHTGSTLPYDKGRIPNGVTRKPGFYAVYWDLPQDGYATQAVGYGIKAFDLGSHGKLFPVQVTTEDKAQVSAHAVLADDGSVYLTIVNKEIGTAPRTVVLKQSKKMGFTKAESIFLGVKDNYAGAIEGFTVGGAKIETDGSWKGKWEKVSTKAGSVFVTVPPTSAVILHLNK